MRLLTITLAAALLAGCATSGQNYVPVIDTQGTDPDRMAQDVRECQAYSTQVMNAAQGAAAGAVVGALLGALLAPRGYRNNVAGQGGRHRCGWRRRLC